MTTTINAAATSEPSNLGQDRELVRMESIMSTATMHNFESRPEVRELRDELREEELQKVSGGYIGETEKNISHGKTTL